jgi:tyrosyl-tRNA synthetase
MKTEPVVTYWRDSATDAEGWIVFDRVINGVAGGGIFMHSLATEQEVKDIAHNMSLKFTVCDPQIGGAKAGIRFNHTDSRASGVLKRFIIDNAVLLKNTWVTAGDLNTDDSYIEHVIQKHLGLVTCQATLGRKYSEATKQPDLSLQLSKLIPHPVRIDGHSYFPLIEGAVGYGVAAALSVAIDTNPTANIPRVAIQGFGAVGSGLALFCQLKKIAKVVAICDKDGYIYSDSEIDVVSLLKHRKHTVSKLRESGADKSVIQMHEKNLLCNLEHYHGHFEVKKISGGKGQLIDLFNTVNFEAFSPCAQRYVIDHDIFELMLEKGVKYLVPGANNPYSSDSVKEEIMNSDITTVADWVANSGTAELFHRGLSVPFNFSSPTVEHEVLEVCAEPIRNFILDANAIRKEKNISLLQACYDLATERLKNPIAFGKKKEVDNRQKHAVHRSIYALAPTAPALPIEERMRLLKSFAEEIIGEDELVTLLQREEAPVAYDGFEPSGRMHIAQGIMKAINVNKMTKSGFTFLFWVADWFAFLNHKMGGDLNKIKKVGEYFIEVWKACGMDMSRVKFLWASEEFEKRTDYWAKVLHISTSFTQKRIQHACTIMGKKEGDELSASQLFYPCMQAADIGFLGVDVCQLGVDQRKINMLAREYYKGEEKPIVISHHMLAGLKKGQAKMSKSDAKSAIFMEDSFDDVNDKIKAAYCPENEEKDNPCLEYFKYIIYPYIEDRNAFDVNIGDHIYPSYETLVAAYIAGNIHPIDLKKALAFYLNIIIEPIRQHFATDENAKEIRRLVREYTGN